MQMSQPQGNSIMNMGDTSSGNSQDSSMQGVMDNQQDPSAGDDGVSDSEYTSDIQTNLESHLNNLPDEQKQFLATYATTPEVATVLGIVNGKEVYDYFMKYVDPSKRIKVETVTKQPSPQAPGQAQSIPEHAAVQSKAAANQQAPQQQTPQAGVLNMR